MGSSWLAPPVRSHGWSTLTAVLAMHVVTTGFLRPPSAMF